MATSHLADAPAELPQSHRPQFRTVDIEIQRSTLGGGWTSVALAESPEWAHTITAGLNWLEHNPVFSEAV